MLKLQSKHCIKLQNLQLKLQCLSTNSVQIVIKRRILSNKSIYTRKKHQIKALFLTKRQSKMPYIVTILIEDFRKTLS